ncbi:MAG: putative sulfate exporter family transporter, partial [Gemmatimonadetes bacterium]|nr:putative sulfate exporter family transporter [Gemmatimonadota bacterium]
ICGASAIVATAPGIRAKQEEVAYAIANITVFGIAAMFLYPYLANALFGGDQALGGLFLGTSIHETAQVTGAALMYDQTFGVTGSPCCADVAVVTKLVRNLSMAAVIPFMAYLYARTDPERTGAATGGTGWVRLVPLFVLGFLALAAIRSIGDGTLGGGGLALGFLGEGAWGDVISRTKQLSGYTLTTAMAAVGLGTAFGSLRGLGLRPFCVGLFAAAMVGVAAFVAVLLLGPLVSI